MYGSFYNTENKLVVIREKEIWKKIASYSPGLWGTLSKLCKAFNILLSSELDRRKMWAKHLTCKVEMRQVQYNLLEFRYYMWGSSFHYKYKPFCEGCKESPYCLYKLHPKMGTVGNMDKNVKNVLTLSDPKYHQFHRYIFRDGSYRSNDIVLYDKHYTHGGYLYHDKHLAIVMKNTPQRVKIQYLETCEKDPGWFISHGEIPVVPYQPKPGLNPMYVKENNLEMWSGEAI